MYERGRRVGNILSYLKWRGDLTFKERAFCEVDNLVLAELAYIDFSGIVPEQGTGISVREAAERFYGCGRENECQYSQMQGFPAVLADSKRFKNVILSRRVEILDEVSQTDFSALCAELGDETFYVSFRGTSDLLMGWREDFSMSFQPMPAQRLAAEYLAEVLNENVGIKYRIGGHSKGGNLAVYASMMCPEDRQGQIMEIYSNDGPGFCGELFDMERYRKVQPKLIRIVPEFSVIGSLFEHEMPSRIVASEGKGFYQHDGMTWQIEGDHFLDCGKRSEECEFYNSIFDQWIESASLEQRKIFTKDLFDALEAGGAKKCSELSQSSFEEMEAIILSIVQSENRTKIVVGKFFMSLFRTFNSIRFRKLFLEKEMIQGILLFFAGMFLLVEPEFSAQCIGTFIGLAAVFWLGKKQLDCAFSNDDRIKKKKFRMILQMFLMCVVILLIAQRDILLRFSGIMLGGLFLYAAYKWTKTAFEKREGYGIRIARLALALFSFLLGMVPIITSGLTLWHYVYASGSFILLYGIGRILHAMYINGKQNMMQRERGQATENISQTKL